MKAFREFTMIQPDTQCEVMVDIDTQTGKIIGLYCYKNHIPIIYNYETDKEYRITVKEGKNPLFVHIDRKAAMFKIMATNGFILLLDDEDKEYEKEVELIERSLSLNKIGHLKNFYL